MEKWIEKIGNWLHWFSQIILFLMAFLVTFDVSGRYFFKQPIIGAVELTGYGLSFLIFLSLAVTHLHKEHVTIDFIVEKFPLKVQWIFESIINLVITMLMLAMSASIFWYAIRLHNSNTITGDLGIPISIFAFISTLGGLVFALTALLFFIKSFQKVVKKDDS